MIISEYLQTNHTTQHNTTSHRCCRYTWVISGSPDQCVRWGVHGFELHRLWDVVVGANPQHLFSSHQDSVEMFGWVEEDLDVTNAALLPLANIPVPSIQFGALLEQDLLVLLSRLCLHLSDKYSDKYNFMENKYKFTNCTKMLGLSTFMYLGQRYYGLKVNVHIFRSFFFITSPLISIGFRLRGHCRSKHCCSSICPWEISIYNFFFFFLRGKIKIISSETKQQSR